ncbi:hypothetical protein [Emticicia sp. C21]|uniref:hypothetical protein n=1 Tax=Emticicia sp. C21 TaxID=2302915 RepID=UPI0011C168BB|nr:hypothetical protein [Emticicia sp. C21]
MGSPNAKLSNVADYTKVFQTNLGEKNILLKEPNILPFFTQKYYASSDLMLKSRRKTIQSKGLFDFLKSLGISPNIAQYYFHEISVYNKLTQEKLKTLGFLNEEEGWELINPFFRGSIGVQTVSFIRGSTPKPENIHIFKDSLDYLAFLSKLAAKRL